MAKMGRYCKAYPVSRFRNFSNWTENASALRKERNQNGDVAPGLTDADFLYLQETLTVTDGIFLDENVVFDSITPEWEHFCKNVLNFDVPLNEDVSANKPNGHAAESNA